MSGQAPLIVVFGAAVRAGGLPSETLRRRVDAAAALGGREPGSRYMPTGGVGRHPPSEARVMAALLAEHGIDPSCITLEETGTDTLSSVHACVRLIRAGGMAGRVYAATSAYHLPRCLILLRLAGVRASACPPPAFPASHRFAVRWFWRLREAVAIPVDTLLMLLGR